MPGEFDFIQWIRTQQQASDLVPLPAGDDLAIIKWPADDLLLVGVDQVLDGVHFDSTVHSPRQIGRKAMNRNLSDCAAMACLPVAAVATIAAKKVSGTFFLQELYSGMREAAKAHDCVIVGGDTGSWDGKLVVTVTILGRSAGIKPITRSGARLNDFIYVTGPLGGSILGRNMTFTPRVELARQLARDFRITAMIDLSDGLSRDLRHICQQSGLGAEVWGDRVPIHEDAIEMRRDGHSPLEHALHDGEDYELLFTTDDEIPEELATLIGMMVPASDGILLVQGEIETPLEPKGWEHSL